MAHRARVLAVGLIVLACIDGRPEAASAGVGLSVGPPPATCYSQICADVSVEAGAGSGSGSVTSQPAGISCTVAGGASSGTCTASFALGGPTTVTLTFTPAAGSECHARPSCAYSVNVAGSATIRVSGSWFRLKHFDLVVTRSGAGTGKVTSPSAGIDCGAACSKTYDYGTQVTLTATPDAGSVFAAWTGACEGQGSTCNLTIQQATTTDAVFELAAAPVGAATGGGSQSDSTVEADIVGAAAGKNRIGRRVVRLELTLHETVSATLTLRRAGQTLAGKQFAKVKAGIRILALLVPDEVVKGKARLQFALKDVAGHTLSGRRTVEIPRK
jgi:hypothetical protein